MRNLHNDSTGISGFWGGLLMIIAAIVLLAFVGIFSLIIFPIVLICLVKMGKMSVPMALGIIVALFIIGAAFIIGTLALIFSSFGTETADVISWLL